VPRVDLLTADLDRKFEPTAGPEGGQNTLAHAQTMLEAEGGSTLGR
jgi:hypothetical protein